MISPYALLRLAWRPLTILHLLVLLALASVPFIIAVGDVVDPVIELWRRTASAEVQIALWHALAFAPGGCGYLLAIYRLELQHTLLSWPLPGVRTALLSGTICVGLIVAAVMGTLVARNEALIVGVAAGAIASYTFMVGNFSFDVAVPLVARIAAFLPLAGIIARPGVVAEMTRAQPFAVAIVALVLAAAMLPAVAGRQLARERPFLWSRYQPGTARARTYRGDAARAWTGSLATRSLIAWLRAASFEARLRFPLQHLGHATVAVLIARILDNPGILPVLATGFLMGSGTQLSARICYPLSRVQRAQLTYLGTAIDAVTFFGITAVLIYISDALPLPRLPLADRDTITLHWIAGVGCAFALAPLAQWGRLIWPPETAVRLASRVQTAHFLRLLAYMLATNAASAITLRSATLGAGPGNTLMTIAFLTLIVQLVHWALVYDKYVHSDLLTVRQ